MSFLEKIAAKCQVTGDIGAEARLDVFSHVVLDEKNTKQQRIILKDVIDSCENFIKRMKYMQRQGYAEVQLKSMKKLGMPGRYRATYLPVNTKPEDLED